MTVNLRAPNGVAGDTLAKPINTTADAGPGANLGVLDVYGGMSFIYALSEEVSKSLVEVLQDFFMAYPLGAAFNTTLAKVNKSVIIKENFSADTQQLPQVVIQSTPAEHIPLHLGNKQGVETFEDKDYITYSGDVNVATSLNIYDSGILNVQKLSDVVFLAFMYYVPACLSRRFMFPQPQVRFTNPTKVTGQNIGGEVFRNTLTVPIRTSWHQYFEVAAPNLAALRYTITKET
jgi:hypothetical protein